MLLWHIEQAAEKEESFGSTKLTSKLFQLARTWCFQGIRRFCWKRELLFSFWLIKLFSVRLQACSTESAAWRPSKKQN
uniref:Uncharacterized protein n=1 Tax=Salix viminalis TaxID=40686 RepID=A0A6N2NL54_SALVM